MTEPFGLRKRAKPEDPSPSPFALWRLARGNRGLYLALMKKHGWQIDEPEHPLGEPLPIPFEIQAFLACYVPGRGWLVTKRGLSHSLPGEPGVLQAEVMAGLRAMRHALAREGIRGPDED